MDEHPSKKRMRSGSEHLRRDIDYLIHEIRTPLTAISSSAELLDRDSVSPGERRMLVEIILSESTRLNDLLEDFSRHCLKDANPWLSRAASAAIDIGALVREAVTRFGSRASSHPIRMNVPGRILPVSGDRRMLEVVLRNLLGNAIKYSPDGGEIRIDVQEGSEGVEIVVRDQGVGIPQESFEEIFRPSFRGQRGECGTRGTGLGLAIVWAIVRSHGGTVKVESQEGRGTAFHLVLPLMK